MGHLAAVQLSGGTQMAEGLVESVTTLGGTTTLGLSSFNGVVYHYTVPNGIAVTVNGVLGSLSTSHVGKYVQLRVGSDSSEAVSVAVDTVSNFVQGPIKRLGTVGTARSVYITDAFTGKEVSYTVSQSAAITYNGELRTLSQIEAGWYVTVMVSNNMIVQMDAYPGSVTVEGTLSSITYGAATVIQITLEDDSIVSYSLDITDLPDINRSGKASTIDQLRTGDQVMLTLRYNEISRIDATPQTANLTGVIDRVNLERSGVIIDVTLSDGKSVTYTVPEGVSVSQNGSASNIYNLKPGFTIAMVTNGEQIISIDITAVAASSDQLVGTIYTITPSGSNKSMTILTAGNPTPINVDLRSVKIIADRAGASLNLTSGFATGDTVLVMGAYDGATFVANILIKQ